VVTRDPSRVRAAGLLAGGRPRIVVAGPLAPFAEGFRTELTARGYTRWVVAQHTHLMAHLSAWLLEERLSADQLTAEAVGAFVAARRAGNYELHVSWRGMAPLLQYLRGLGVVPQPAVAVPAGPAEELLASYRAYLTDERGLAPLSVERYLRIARVFVSGLPAPVTSADLEAISAAQIADFLLAEAGRLGRWGTKASVTALRSLLRYLHLTGQIPRPLAGSVPSPAGWGLAALPRAVPAELVTRLLEACDPGTPLGTRDYAIMLMLWRLGLRNSEVAFLSLDDVDWQAGEITVRGKGSRSDRLPLPTDVGQALAGYLVRARPRWGSERRLFLIHRAPYCGLSRSAVVSVVAAACDRAGLERISPHRLRHSAASDILAAGAGLAEVGQLLRHQAQSTTAVYAKLDRRALGELVRPWPGAS
jgi:integrase/recombinase XerD